MKISICITTYNSEKFIKETLDSVINQNMEPYEIIVSDNASEDNTQNIVSRYIDVKLHINANNVGVNENHNKCIDMASGEYLLLLSSDDKFSNMNVIRNLNEIISKYKPDCIALGSGKNGDSVLKYRKYSGVKALQLTLTGKLPFRQIFSMILFKKSILNGLRVVSNNKYGYGDDTKFYLDIMKKADTYVNIDSPMISYRINDQSVTNSIDVTNRFKMHNTMLRKWVYNDYFEILGYFTAKWVMAGEIARVLNEMPESHEKLQLLKNGFTPGERIFALLRPFTPGIIIYKFKVFVRNYILNKI